MKLSFLGVRAGGGKTYAYSEVASSRYINDEKTVIVVPTVRLIKEIVRGLAKRHPTIKPSVFYKHENTEGSVVAEAREYLDHFRFGGEILIVTHSCFFQLSYFPNKAQWMVLIDEAPNVYDVLSLSLRENHEIITGLIEFKNSGSGFGLVRPVDETAVKRISDNKSGDEVNELFKPIAKRLTDDRFSTYASVGAFMGLKNGDKDATELRIHSLMKPGILDGFENVTIAAAGFEKTLTFHHWQNAGVEWNEDLAFKERLLRPVHPFNPTVKIYYGYETANSKYRRNELVNKGDDRLRIVIKELMGEKPFAFLENNDFKAKSSLNGYGAGEPLPGMSHGLNEFGSLHNVAILSAYNYDPESRSFLKKVSRFDEDMQAEASFLNIYQAVMRVSIRNDDLINEKTFVLTSKMDANRLHKWLPGSTVHSLDLPQPVSKRVGAPRRHANGNDRRRASEDRMRNDKLLRSGFAGIITPELLGELPIWQKPDTTAITISDYVRDFRGSFFNNYKDMLPKSIIMEEEKWIKSMKEMHNKEIRHKHDIPMISGALFIPTAKAQKIRDTANVQFVKDIWIDVEDGDMTIDQFASAFPLVRLIGYNTLNHTKAKPRYRIRIPTSRHMSVFEFRSIYHEIRYVLKQKGYAVGKRSNYNGKKATDKPFDGIDCRPNPSLLSGLPCQPVKGKDGFFEEFIQGRKDLHVGHWTKQSTYIHEDDGFFDLPAIPVGSEHDALTSEQVAVVAEAEREWNLYGCKRGAGDRGIFELYRSLRQARVPYRILEERLYCAASNASSPSARRLQVTALLKNCIKYR